MSLSEIDLLDVDVFEQGVPHEWFARLRAEDPVHFYQFPSGKGLWVITKHADVTTVSRDYARNSSSAVHGAILGLDEHDDERIGTIAAASTGRQMMTMDPPEHTAYRKLVNRNFTPKVVRLLEDHIRDVTVALLDKAIAMGTCDFVTDVAVDLPLRIISELLGAPNEDRDYLLRLSNRIVALDDDEFVGEHETLTDAYKALWAYARKLAGLRRDDPRDDIITTLINARLDGEPLTDDDLSRFFQLLVIAGNETTRHSSAHGVLAFLQNPEQYRRLAEDPSLLETAVEEILRWATPVNYFRRYVTDDYELRGKTIRRGDRVTIWFASANRDEEVFENPNTFDVGRDPNPHVAFGGGGPHYCLGGPLSRLQLKILFEELVARVDHFEAAGEASRLRSNFMSGLKHVPVRLVPR